MLRSIAYIFAAIFILIGILGFIPSVAPGGMLLGIFHVNLWHNIIHLATGIIALAAAWGGISGFTPSLFFKAFGVIYGIVALLGFYHGATPIFGFIANNFADSILHTVIALVSLYLGFGYCSSCAACEKK